MSNTNCTADVLQIGTAIKPCPCCAACGVLTQVPGQSKFGVQCSGCPLTFPEVYSTPETAITAWSLRRGTAASAGGRGTRGKCSWRKRRSCRRNLRSARERRKVKLIKTTLLVQIPWLHALRAYDQAESSEEKTQAWASLKAMESKVMRVPSLRTFCKALQKHAP